MKMKKVMSTLAISLAAVMMVEAASVGVSATEFEGMAFAEGYEAEALPMSEGNIEEFEVVSDNSLSVSDNEIEGVTMSGQSGILGITKPGKTRIATALATIYKTKYDLYKTIPSVKNPYSLGAMSDEATKRTLASVNVMRLIAGLPFVKTDATLTKRAQSAAVLCAANNKLDHTQAPPSGMSSEMFTDGVTGCAASNLSGGYPTLAEGIIGSMRDKSSSNASHVGHRRLLLNPSMGKTGFGFAPSQDGKTTFGATYAYDTSAPKADYDYVAWPASGYFPNNLLNASDPWSVSFNPEKVKVSAVDVNKLTVIIKGSNGKQYVYSANDSKVNDSLLANQAAPFITFNKQGYGIDNCLIFRPGTSVFGTAALSGDYTVSILGLPDYFGNQVSVTYTVSFFDPEKYINKTVNLDTLELNINESAVEAFVTRIYTIALQRTPKQTEVNYWKEALIDGEKTGAVVAQGFFFSPEFTNKKLSDEAYVEVLYRVMMDRASDAGGKADWVYKLKNGVTREGVFKGFTDSVEFTNVCAKYGIKRGTITVSQARDKNPNLTTFVARLYTKALGRAYEEKGLNDWCNRIITKSWKLDDVATTGFFHSPEFVNKKLNNSDYVKVLYATFFDREPDTEGFNYWIKRMNNGASRDEVLKGFSNSIEFYNLKKKFGV